MATQPRQPRSHFVRAPLPVGPIDLDVNNSQFRRGVGRMQIYVNDGPGKTVTLDVNASDTIENVMAKVSEKFGIPTNEQLLIVAGNEIRLEYNRSRNSSANRSRSRSPVITTAGSRVRDRVCPAKLHSRRASKSMIEVVSSPSSSRESYKRQAEGSERFYVGPTHNLW